MTWPAHMLIYRGSAVLWFISSQKFLCVEESVPCMGVKLCSNYGCQQIDFTVSLSCYNAQQSNGSDG